MTFCIFVARYKENIEWTKEFDTKNVVVYNKGSALNNIYKEYKCLPNVWREGHSYYTYIYENYENLADYTIFLQGNPFDHSPHLIKTLNKYLNKENASDFEFLSETISPCKLSGCSHHKGLPLLSVYTTLFGKPNEDKHFAFGYGAQFIVSKRAILKHPKSFYLQIVKLLENSVNPVEGFVIERFHGLIFTN